MIINRSVLSGIAFAVMLFGLSSGIMVSKAGAFTMEEYRQAVLSNKFLPSQAQADNPTVTVPPQNTPAPQVYPQTPSAPPANPTYTGSQPVNGLNNYYNAVLNRRRTPIYYSNQPAPQPPPPAPNPNTTPGLDPSIPPDNGGSGEPATPSATPPQAPTELTASEARLFELINSARINEGVRPVEIDMRLVEIARLKARDMIDNNYFGHFSPTYGSPGQMLRKFGVNFWSAGENLSKAGDVYKAHMLFLTSTQGHREIMLNPNYNKVGVAVVARGSYVLVVELFAEL